MANAVPSTTFMVSNMPSPTMRPWLLTGTTASSAGTRAPSNQTLIARSSSHAGRLRARHPYEPARLQFGLAPLAFRCRVPRDSAPGAEVHVPVVEPEGADGDVELAFSRVGIHPSDRAAVDVTAHRFEV